MANIMRGRVGTLLFLDHKNNNNNNNKLTNKRKNMHRPHLNSLISFENTIEQATETMTPSPKTITTANNEKNYKQRRAVTRKTITQFAARKLEDSVSLLFPF